MADYLMHFNRNHDKRGRFTKGDGDGDGRRNDRNPKETKYDNTWGINQRIDRYKKTPQGRAVQNRANSIKNYANSWWTNREVNKAKNSPQGRVVQNGVNKYKEYRSEAKKSGWVNRSIDSYKNSDVGRSVQRGVNAYKNYTNQWVVNRQNPKYSRELNGYKDNVTSAINKADTGKSYAYSKTFKNSDNISKAVDAGKNYVRNIGSDILEAWEEKKKKKKKKKPKRVTEKKMALKPKNQAKSN